MTGKERCGDCFFLRRGECRRFPPRPVYVKEIDNYVSVYPEVEGSEEACGEFREGGHFEFSAIAGPAEPSEWTEYPAAEGSG